MAEIRQIAIDGKRIKEAVEAVETKTIYTAGDNVSITDGVISSTDTKYTAGDGIAISDENVISADVTIPTATSLTEGVIKLGSDTVQTVAAETASTTANRTYPIQLNSDNQAVVNVPWEGETQKYAHYIVLKTQNENVSYFASLVIISTLHTNYTYDTLRDYIYASRGQGTGVGTLYTGGLARAHFTGSDPSEIGYIYKITASASAIAGKYLNTITGSETSFDFTKNITIVYDSYNYAL